MMSGKIFNSYCVIGSIVGCVLLMCLGCKEIKKPELPIETLFCEGTSLIGGTSWHKTFIWEQKGEFTRYSFEGYKDNKKWNKFKDFKCQEIP